MVIINPSNATQPAAFNRPAGPAPVLPTDRVLNAVVMGQRAEHLYELASGNLRLMAESQTALRRGEQLLLQVTGKDAQQRPTLQVINTSAGAISPLLKAMLPQQQGINQLLANITPLLNKANDSTLNKLSSALVNALPSRQQLSDPAGLRAAILSSGFFMEAQLAAGIAPANDLKSALLRLAQQLENLRQSNAASTQTDPSKASKLSQDYSGLARTAGAKAEMPPSTNSLPNLSQPPTAAKDGLNPVSTNYGKPAPSSDLPGVLRSQPRIAAELPEQKLSQEAVIKQLLQDSRGAIARLESHQLLHLQQKDPLQSQYLIEIPVRNDDGIDVWQMQLQWQRTSEDQEHPTDNASDEDQYQRRWQINLNFDLPGLGPINTKVIQQGKQLAITFNTETQATRALIEQRQHELNQRLEEQGIIDTEIVTHTGIGPAASSPLSSHSLLDDQA
ncbi:flagellar hook-length control protein FliK [Zhongshania sp.]|uniref:flagellar hook-length control protein FliK n=1 Tax=Zhongshania sp. TaxID=1971902 RepID=UPI003566BA55